MARPIVIEMIEEELVESLRRKTPAQRLVISLDMWRCARDRLNHQLRTENPDWTDRQIRREFCQRILGPEWARVLYESPRTMGR